MIVVRYLAAFAGLIAGGTSHGFAADAESLHARVALVSETGALMPGETNWLALHFRIDDGWNLYWNGRSDSGYPPSLDLRLPPGFEVGELLWPAPERHVFPGDILDHIYMHEVGLLLPLRAPADLTPGASITLSGRADWLACRNLCIPESMKVELTLPVAAAAADAAHRATADAADTGVEPLFRRSRARLPQPLASARPPISISWHGEELRLEAPHASGMSFFPAEDCSALAHPIVDTTRDGDRLTLRLASDETRPLRAHGVLEVRGTSSSIHWYGIDVSPDARTSSKTRPTE